MMRGTIQRILKNKVRPETKIKIFKLMVVPVVKYASETWTIARHEERFNINDRSENIKTGKRLLTK